MNLKHVIQLFNNMGIRYVFYRIKHELEKKSGILIKKHPENIQLVNSISLKEWKNSKIKFLIDSKDDLLIPKFKSKELEIKAKRILNGEIQFFNFEWLNLGKDYDWLTNPSNNYHYDNNLHWSRIPDLSEEAGDIKYVWEKSRFSYLLTLIRYDYHFEEDLSEFVFSEIDSWIEANPINRGPNWRCSQEISLRIFNWCFVLYYYQKSLALTEERWQNIQNVIYASLNHVYKHIDFSRIAVRNNHAITETLFLTLSNVLFPFITETKKWSTKGKKWFEKEISYQIYNDGTFLQFSMNYHRVVIQLLTFAFSVYERNKLQFSEFVYERAYKSTYFLYQCMQEENGWLPNYGSNDGALFFSLSDTDYRDFRPQLNTLHYMLTGEFLHDDRYNNEDLHWFGNKKILKQFCPIEKINGTLSFDIGGYYLFRKKDFFTFIRCGSHKDRPAQADNLHLDIWYKGENILRDSGTYRYNTSKDNLHYFMGSSSHNVVMVNEESQMLKGGRFIWYYWTQKKIANWKETKDDYIFTGEIKAFQFLNKNATHKRVVKISKSNPIWMIEDEISYLDNYSMKQIWHPNSDSLDIISNTEKYNFTSYNSNYYGSYDENESIFFNFKKRINTLIRFN